VTDKHLKDIHKNFLGDQVAGKDVLAAAETVAGSSGRLRPEVIQIDDGYQDREGKKDTNERFPDGLTAYAHRISNAGARPGLYLHLLTHDGADIQRRIREARQKGFTYFKLRVIGKHFQIGADTKKTSFELFRESLVLLREAAGEDAYLLLCGENTEPNRAAVGFVDACRTGDDAGRDNLPRAIPQVLRSYQLQGRWFAVDNDAYYMGTDVQNVSEIKGGWPLVRTWASMVGLSCGAAFTSDPWYWESFKPYWRNVEAMTPPAKERTEVLDLCTSRDWPRLVGRVRRPWGEWTVALLWNPGTTEQSVTLDFAQAGMDPKKRYAVWSFWDNRYLGVAQGSWTTPRLAPYACQHLSFTELDPSPNRPVLIGSDLHIYCGAAELTRVTSRRGAMTIELTDAGAREGDLFIYSRYQPILSTAVGCTVSGIGSGGENVWRITLSERQRGSPQRIELELLLPVTRQLWFWLVLAIVTGSLLLVAWQYMAKLRLKRAHDLEQERGRIARDIHDDLGASLTQIALLSELAQADLHEPEVARGHVNEIFNMARTLTRSVDEIVWAVNPANDTVEKFAAFIGQYVERFTRTSGLSCQLELPDELPAQPMESALRHHLFLATKEALHNVSAHAGARTVRLDLSLTGGWLKLVIADDGRGFTPEDSESVGPGRSGGQTERVGGGHGLSNMRQRMAAVGGTFEIQSMPGQGTRVTLQVKVGGRGNI
jgi:signal transduction histidine kinase